MVCNDTFCVPKCSCGSYDIKMTTSETVICSNCGNTLSHIECEEGHKISICDLENINVFLIPNSQLYRDIIELLNEELELQFKGVFFIINGNIIENVNHYKKNIIIVYMQHLKNSLIIISIKIH